MMLPSTSSLPQAPTSPVNVAVCIATCRRPQLLSETLRGLSQLAFAKVPAPRFSIVIVDNDADASARAVATEWAPRFSCPLQYLIEPQRGISEARNRCLIAALPDHDAIVFIDDDEVPSPHWLDELLHTQAATGAAVVAGPVLPAFDSAVPAWMVRGGLFDRSRHATGTPVAYAGSGNVLVMREVFAAVGNFDPRFSVSGGGDTHFFMRVARRGYRMVWCDEAVATEFTPSTRCTPGWLVRRGYRCGCCLARCWLDLDPTLRRRLERLCTAAANLLIGCGGVIAGLLRGRACRLRGAQRFARGLGMMMGACGRSYSEYTRVHGS